MNASEARAIAQFKRQEESEVDLTAVKEYIKKRAEGKHFDGLYQGFLSEASIESLIEQGYYVLAHTYPIQGKGFRKEVTHYTISW